MSIVHIAFYPSDWLAGTRGLSAEETGVYITLICRMYEMAGPIERDDARLARLCGSKSKPAFVKVLEYLISEGKITVTENGLFNERAQKEIEKVISKSSRAKEAAEARWDKKPNKNNKGSDANASTKHMLEPCQSEPEPDIYRDTNVSLVISEWNSAAEKYGWPKVQKATPKRKKAALARLRDSDGIEGLRAALARASQSSFIAKNTFFSFDWLMSPSNLTKLMEGNYDDRPSQSPEPDSSLRLIADAARAF